jgi:hypothetical protein
MAQRMRPPQRAHLVRLPVPAAAAGRPYALAGAVVWAPLCGAAHKLGDWLQPQRVARQWLEAQGLLDPAPASSAAEAAAAPACATSGAGAAALPAAAAAAAAAATAVGTGGTAAPAAGPRRVEDVSESEKLQWVKQLKNQEMKALKRQLQAEAEALAAARQQPAAAPVQVAAGQAASQQGEQQQAPASRWSLFRRSVA